MNTRPVLERFLSKVFKTDSCWYWLAAVVDGYGKFRPTPKGGMVKAHRWAYQYYVGPIPEGKVLDHLCRNRACVNPAHLEPVTLIENVMRGFSFASVNAKKQTCPSGHPYSGKHLWVSKHGWRQCRTCSKARRLARKVI